MPQIPAPDPAQIFENALYSLVRSLDSIARIDPSEVDGTAYFDASLRYRMLAIAALLSRADRRRFFGLLRKSGLIRRHFLRLVAAGHLARKDRFCGSWNLSFIDALAGGDTDTAAAIAEASPDRHAPEVEYEDDFLRYRFLQLMTLRIHRGTAVDVGPLLDRWDEVREGGDDAYLGVCRALHLKEAGLLKSAMGELLQVRQEQVRVWNKDFSFDPELRATESAVFLFGLAFLRVAELLGISTSRDDAFLPSIARSPLLMQLNPDSWMDPLSGL